MTTKIRIVMKSFNNQNYHFRGLTPYTQRMGLPESRVLCTVLRSPHIDKKSREQFAMQIKKQFLVIKTETHELRKRFFRLKRQRIFGAQYEAHISFKTRSDKGAFPEEKSSFPGGSVLVVPGRTFSGDKGGEQKKDFIPFRIKLYQLLILLYLLLIKLYLLLIKLYNLLILLYLRVAFCPVTHFCLFILLPLCLCLPRFFGVVVYAMEYIGILDLNIGVVYAMEHNRRELLDLNTQPPRPFDLNTQPPRPFDLNELPEPEPRDEILPKQDHPAPAGPSHSATGEQVEAAVVTPNIEETTLLQPLVDQFTSLKSAYDPAGYIESPYLEGDSLESFKSRLLDGLRSADNAEDFLKNKQMEHSYYKQEFMLKKRIAEMLSSERRRGKFCFKGPKEIREAVDRFLVHKGLAGKPSQGGIGRQRAELSYIRENCLNRNAPLYRELLAYFFGLAGPDFPDPNVDTDGGRRGGS